MLLFKWFSDNQIKANINKCHLLVNRKDEIVINLGETEVKNSELEKLLGISRYKTRNAMRCNNCDDLLHLYFENVNNFRGLYITQSNIVSL